MQRFLPVSFSDYNARPQPEPVVLHAKYVTLQLVEVAVTRNLFAAVLDHIARMAGQNHITLAVHFALDAFQNASGETAQVTPIDFLNFNYLFNPMEMDGNTPLAGLN